MSRNESIVEDAAVEWFGKSGFAVGNGLQMALGEATAEREAERSGDSRRKSFGEVVLPGRLREAIRRLNPVLPSRIFVALRDTLLPKQLSGELRVASGESKLEASA